MERGKVNHPFLFPFLSFTQVGHPNGKNRGSIMARIDTVRTDISAFLLALLILSTGFASYLDSVFTLVTCKNERNASGQCAWS